MTITRTTGALAAATALALAGLVMPATANAQTGITVGEPGSAAYQAPTNPPDGDQQNCGTVYVGEYDTELRPAPLPEDGKAIAGLTVTWVGPDQVVRASTVTNEHGGYCFENMFGIGEAMDGFLSFDQSQIDEFNAQPGVSTLELTKVSWDQEFITGLATDPTPLFSYLDTVTAKLHNVNIAFSETAPPPEAPEPMGSLESASLQFFNLPEILRGMLHGGTGGSLGS